VNREALIQALVPQPVRDTNAYQVADAVGLIKLDAMENPFTWPESLQQTLADELARAPLNRYPDPRATEVRQPLREWMGIPDSLEILFGNGSDEIIALLIANCIATGRAVCAPDPSFVMFKVLANQYQVPFHALPLDDAHDIDLDRWLAVIKAQQPGVIFVPQPNNPTGNVFDTARLQSVVDKADALVVIDEAYTAFTDANFIAWADSAPNVVIMRTLSKVGLAGSRFGMLIGHPDWIHQFDKLRLPYNINVLTQIAVRCALQHADMLESQSAAIRAERLRLSEALRQRQLDVWPSEANFVVMQTPSAQARTWFENLKQHGVLVKCLDGLHPSLADTLRVTVGAPHETDALLHAIDQFTAG
jgi:histidinol-phosphate aminotransferase